MIHALLKNVMQLNIEGYRIRGKDMMFAQKNGFSSTEVMLILTIIGVISSTAIPEFIDIVSSAEDNVCKMNMASINTQIEIYRILNDRYPELELILNNKNLFPDGAPKCPAGGSFELDQYTHRVRCSIHGALNEEKN